MRKERMTAILSVSAIILVLVSVSLVISMHIGTDGAVEIEGGNKIETAEMGTVKSYPIENNSAEISLKKSASDSISIEKAYVDLNVYYTRNITLKQEENIKKTVLGHESINNITVSRKTKDLSLETENSKALFALVSHEERDNYSVNNLFVSNMHRISIFLVLISIYLKLTKDYLSRAIYGEPK